MFQVQSSSPLSPSPTISCFSDLVLVSTFPAIDSVLSPKSPFPLPPVFLSLPDQQSFHQVSRFSKVVTDSRLAASTLDYFSLSEFITRCTARPLFHRLPFRLSLTTTQFRHSRFGKSARLTRIHLRAVRECNWVCCFVRKWRCQRRVDQPRSS